MFESIKELLGEKLYSSLKGALIATLGVLIQQLLAALAPDSVPADGTTAIMLAIVTTLLNAAKQYLLPKDK